MEFMASALAKLVRNLEKHQFRHTNQVFADDFDLLLRKCIFPYDWFDCFDKPKENHLPLKK